MSWPISSRPSTPPRRRPRRKRRVLLVALGLSALGGGLVVLGVFPQNAVRRFAEGRLQTLVGPSSRIEHLRLTPWALRGEVVGLVLWGDGYRVEVAEVRFALVPSALLRGTLAFRFLHLRQPVVLLTESSAPPPSSSTFPRALPATVEDLRVTEGRLEVAYPALGGELIVPSIDLSGPVGRGALVITAPAATWRRETPVVFGPFSARLAVTPSLAVRLEALEAGTSASRIRMSGELGPLAAPDLDLLVEGDLDARDAALFGFEDARGEVRVTGTIVGRVESLRAELRAASESLLVEGTLVERLEASLTHEAPSNTRVRARGSWNGGSLRVEGRLTGGEVSARADLTGVVLSRLPGTSGLIQAGTLSGVVEAKGPLDGVVPFTARLTAAGVEDALGGAGRLEGSAAGSLRPAAATWEGQWRMALDRAAPPDLEEPGLGAARLTAAGRAEGGKVLRAEGRLEGEAELRVAAGPVRTIPVQGTFALDGEDLTLDARALEGDSLRLTVRTLGDRTLRLEARATGVDLQPFLGSGGGTLDLQADLRGELARLSGTASLSVRDLRVEDASLGDAEALLTLEAGSGRLDLAAPALGTQGEATLRLGPGGGLSGTLRASSLDLAPLAPFLPEPARGRLTSGQVDGEVRFDVPFSDYRATRIEASVSGMKVTSGDWTLHASAPQLVFEKGTLALEKVVADVNGIKAELSGLMGLAGGPSDVVVRMDADMAGLPAPAPWRLEGRLALQARLRGTLEHPVVDGGLELTGVGVRRGEQGPAFFALPEGRLSLEGDRVEWTGVQATLAGGSVTTEGRVPLRSLLATTGASQGGAPAQEARILVAGRDLALGTLMTAAAPAASPVEASVSGELRLRGAVADPLQWSGELVVEPLGASVAGLDLRLEAIRLALERGILSLPQFRLEAGGQTLTGSGRADLRSGDLQAKVEGQLDLRALAPLIEPAATVQGDALVDLRIGGSLREPRPEGSVVFRRLSVRPSAFPQPITDGEGRLALAEGILRVEAFSARLGGGTLEAKGTAGLAGVRLSDVDLTVTGRDLALRYPLDFKTRVGADLRLAGETGAFLLTGQVRVERGLYDTDIFLDQLLRADALPVREPSPLLRTVALDLDLRARDRIVVRNNLAQLTVRGSARVRGDLESPAPYGRFEIAEGGTVFLQTRKFTVDQGSLSFEGTLDPMISLRAESVLRQVGDEDVAVTVTATGPLRKPSLTLSSDPSYSEREIASLIATGRRGLALDSSAWVAGEQLGVLLAGRLTRNLAKGLLDLGLDEVDLQPELLAREADPGARFTFGKNLSPRAKLVYSVGLNDPEATYFLGEYKVRVGAEATGRVQRDDDGEYTYGLGQRFRFGGPPRRRRRARADLFAEIERVDFAGQLGLPEAALREAARAKPGDVVSPWDLQTDAERVENELVSAGHIEALVSARTEGKVARFEVDAGALYRAEVRGLERPPDLGPLLREARSEGEALARARERLFAEAEARGLPYARIDSRVEGEDEQRTLVFEVEPGRKVARTEVLFPGAAAVSEGRLREVSGGPAAILRDPEGARRRLREEYRRAHYLAAEVGEPEIFDPPHSSLLRISLAISEGPRARVAAVRFDGGTMAEADLLSLVPMRAGSVFDPGALAPALERIRAFYLEKGFASIRVAPRLEPAGPDYDIVFAVTEGEARTIGSILVTGQGRTRESVIRSRLEVRAGQPLDPRKLVVSERRILELNVFSRVSVTASDDDPATVSVQVVERGPYAAAYDVRYNDVDRLSGVLDVEVGNLGGYALALGARYRQGADLRETRASLSLPVLGRTRGFLATVFRQEEDFLLVREGAGSPLAPPALQDTERQQGFEIQQALKLGNRWDALYGYRFRRVASLATGFLQDVSSVGVALLRETRDNPLDARRGRFWSLSFDLAPKQLGSDLAFFRSYGQGFFIRSLGPSWTWAQAYRLGLANGLREKQGEQVQIVGKATELFRAGGASSLRGFATDSVGPKGPVAGLSRGGEAVIIMNQEIRFHHPSGLGAAAFYDVGNVFPRIRDIDFDLRHSVGVGIRYTSPIGLVRVDLGFPLGRQAGERSYQWFFTLGQAF